MKESVTVYFNPETRSWSETNYDSLEEPVYDWSEQQTSGGCGKADATASLVLLPALLAAAFVIKG